MSKPSVFTLPPPHPQQKQPEQQKRSAFEASRGGDPGAFDVSAGQAVPGARCGGRAAPGSSRFPPSNGRCVAASGHAAEVSPLEGG